MAIQQPARPESPLSASQQAAQASRLIHGEALDVLRSLPDACVDAVVTDPPAGIAFMGKGWDTDHGGRRQWIATMQPIFAEALRVTKPGGHALVWALPRTSHWTATALEDAGWDVRDVITHINGQGFPKSLDVGKAIDKAAGAQRKVVGKRWGAYPDADRPSTRSGRGTKVGMFGIVGEASMRDVTAPATDAARQWDGWGTALKPANEHWILCRKPLAEGAVAANVLAHGTGALNIGASRVAGEAWTRSTPHRGDLRGGAYGSNNGKRINWQPQTMPQSGRWPPNLLFSHSLFCLPAACADDCPVAALDAQSGVRTSGLLKAGTRRSTGGGYMGHMPPVISGTYGGDTGGASRFFPTFRYVAKASRAERNRGCSSLDAKPVRRYGEQGQGTTPQQTPRHELHEGNHHPTVKPLALMSWLITLITPPGGLVLDPFAGSGSTLCAAKAGGWRYLGIEREAEYVAIAEARLAAIPEPAREPSLGSALAIEQPKPVQPVKKPRQRKPKTAPTTPLWSEVSA